MVGKQRVAWRYDPVLLTDKYTISCHAETFEKMSSELFGYIDRCIFSFVEIYKKLRLNMPELLPVSEKDKNTLAESLGSTALKYGIRLQTCGTNENYSEYGIHSSGCITPDILGRANNITFKNLRHKGMRDGCHCIESRDIGAYDTCINGCSYCYANKNPEIARKNYKLHDPYSPLLLGNLMPGDVLHMADQKSCLTKDDIPGQQKLNLE